MITPVHVALAYQAGRWQVTPLSDCPSGEVAGKIGVRGTGQTIVAAMEAFLNALLERMPDGANVELRVHP